MNAVVPCFYGLDGHYRRVDQALARGEGDQGKYLQRTVPDQFKEMLMMLVAGGGDVNAAMKAILKQMNSDPAGQRWLGGLNDLFQQTVGAANEILSMMGQPSFSAPPLDLLLFIPETLDIPIP